MSGRWRHGLGLELLLFLWHFCCSGQCPLTSLVFCFFFGAVSEKFKGFVKAQISSAGPERGSAVGTISSCFDLSQGLGSLVVGGVAALSSYRGTFATGAVCSMLAVLLLWGRVVPRMTARARLANEVS